MVLESTIVCADTSDFMRNGDFLPTRIQAQQDAVNLVCLSKTRSNPENNVGLLTMSPNVKVLVTMTTDVGRILATLHQVPPCGKLNFMTGIRVAHLALKHRQGKNHRMRIVAFVGSPIENDEKELTKLAKKLKKEKVCIDIINFGEDGANSDKLNSFIETINGSEGTGSHLVTIPPGTALSDALLKSSIIVGEDGSGAVPGLPGAGGGEYEFGFDPSADPELAMALRISMEEQRQRQEDEARHVMDESATETTPTVQAATETTDSEEALLKQALAMSMQPDEGTSSSLQETPLPDFGTMTEDEQIAYAMHMSLQADETPAESGDKGTPMETETPAPSAAQIRPDDGVDDYAEVMSDPSFLQSVLENLPGVDPTSEAVRNVMGTLMQQQQSQQNKDGDKEKKEDKEKK